MNPTKLEALRQLLGTEPEIWLLGILNDYQLHRDMGLEEAEAVELVTAWTFGGASNDQP